MVTVSPKQRVRASEILTFHAGGISITTQGPVLLQAPSDSDSQLSQLRLERLPAKKLRNLESCSENAKPVICLGSSSNLYQMLDKRLTTTKELHHAAVAAAAAATSNKKVKSSTQELLKFKPQ